jgi:tetratricopeptide (TPR) repeat protein
MPPCQIPFTRPCGSISPAASTRRPGSIKTLGLAPNYAKVYNSLGRTLAKKGLPDEAIAAYGETIRLQPDDVLALTSLANLHQKQRRLDKAELYFRQALEGRRKALGEKHAHTAGCCIRLALFLRDGKRTPDAAIPYFRTALAMYLAAEGENSKGAAIVLRDLAFTLHLTKQDGEVEALYRRAPAVPADTWFRPSDRAEAVHRLAAFLTENRDCPWAEPLWLGLWEWIKAHPDNTAFGLNEAEIAPKVTAFSMAWGKAEEAGPWTRKKPK